jgi:Cof subfamily protein (haloacid dehalogenase superfamily)
MRAGGLSKVYAGRAAARCFDYFDVRPGDPRVPDLVGTAQYGVVYTGGKSKIAEHGGSHADDLAVPLVVSGTVTRPTAVPTSPPPWRPPRPPRPSCGCSASTRRRRRPSAASTPGPCRCGDVIGMCVRDHGTVTSTYRTSRPLPPTAAPHRPVRLIATDLDGTLLRDDKTVSDRTIAALADAEAAGIEVFFVTGRPARWMDAVAEHTARHGIAICANGAAVYDLHRDRLLVAYPLDARDALAVVAALREAVPGTAFAVERTSGFAYEPDYPAYVLEADVEVAPVEELLADGHERPLVLKLLARHPSLDPDVFLATARKTAGDHGEITRSSPSALLEISGRGVSKATTLARCCAERGISADEVVAFGDMPNDLEMLTWAGTSYAVANAHPEVLAATTHRTAMNEDDGVARAIEDILADRIHIPGSTG